MMYKTDKEQFDSKYNFNHKTTDELISYLDKEYDLKMVPSRYASVRYILNDCYLIEVYKRTTPYTDEFVYDEYDYTVIDLCKIQMH